MLKPEQYARLSNVVKYKQEGHEALNCSPEAKGQTSFE